ncbi:MAG TPA: CAAD domain-containing protein [Nostocaceae cyanobacterium]|nr:CAAD domain-containing protein [Nostocaceae cyanobacterium]
MATEQQQPQPTNSVSQPGALAIEGADSTSLPKLSSSTTSQPSWQQVLGQGFDFLDKLPDYLGNFFGQNQQALLTLIFIVSALITLKVVLALLDAVNNVPLLKPTFEIIGLIYSFWFTLRYLIKTENRQELGDKINSFKRQTLG